MNLALKHLVEHITFKNICFEGIRKDETKLDFQLECFEKNSVVWIGK